MSPTLSERQRRVKILADALDDEDPDVVLMHEEILGKALAEGFDAVRFFNRIAPVLRGHKISSPPSLHTWRAVRKELMRRAAAALSARRD